MSDATTGSGRPPSAGNTSAGNTSAGNASAGNASAGNGSAGNASAGNGTSRWTRIAGTWIAAAIGDARFAVRLFRRSPAAASLAILSLALGIGANTAVFSLIDTVVLRPLPVREPGRLFQVAHAGRQTTADSSNYALFQAIRDARDVVEGALFVRITDVKVTHDSSNGRVGAIEPVLGQYVTGGYHATLGVRALLGRAIEPADSTDAGMQPVAVLGYDYWRQRFAADPQVLGRTIIVDGAPYTIVGVTGPEFFGLEVGRRVDVTVPLNAREEEPGWYSRPLIVRLAPAVTAERARATLQGRFAQVIDATGMGAPQRRNAFERLELTPAGNGSGPLISDLRERFSRPLLVLFGVVALVLLLACANVSAVQLARAQTRTRELGIRQALGAGRGRLVRQLLTESALLAAIGGAAGVLLAWWASNLLVGYLPDDGLPGSLTIEPDRRVLAFTAGVSLLAAIGVGIMPAWISTRRDAHAALASGDRIVAGRPLGVGRLLVIGQIALACVLLTGAVLFLRSLWNLRSVDAGFDDRQVLLASIDADEVKQEDDQMAPVYRDLLTRIAALPGVEHVTLSTIPPLSGNEDGKPFGGTGQAPPPEGLSIVQVNTIAPDYFRTFGVPILRGRGLTADDRKGTRRVVVMSEGLARRLFGTADPIGQPVGFGRDQTDPAARWEVVGIARDVRDRDARTAPSPMLYTSYEQVAEPDRSMTFAIRGRGTPSEWTARLRQEIAAAAPGVVLLNVMTLSRAADERLVRDRMLAALCGYFGLIAILLTGIGIYGLMAHTVAGRTAEIGVRMAFGAGRAQVRWLVLRESLPLIAWGLAAGLFMTLSATRVAAGLLFNVRPTDPTMLTTALVFMAMIAIAAVLVPAWRASRVDPLVALRAE